MTIAEQKVISSMIDKLQESLSRCKKFLDKGNETEAFHFLMEAGRHLRDATTGFIVYKRLYQLKGVKRYGRKRKGKIVRGETK